MTYGSVILGLSGSGATRSAASLASRLRAVNSGELVARRTTDIRASGQTNNQPGSACLAHWRKSSAIPRKNGPAARLPLAWATALLSKPSITPEAGRRANWPVVNTANIGCGFPVPFCPTGGMIPRMV